MFERLEESFEKEQQFTADVSHELRTPVTVIISPVSYTHLDVYKRQPFLPVSDPFLTLTSLVRLVAKRKSPSPVSYTHLDVYKRQVGTGAMSRAVFTGISTKERAGGLVTFWSSSCSQTSRRIFRSQ